MSRNSAAAAAAPVVVLDNGAGFCKASVAVAGARDQQQQEQQQPAQGATPTVVPNCLGRPRNTKKWVAADLLQACDDVQGIALRRPLDRGYLTHLDAEKEVWERLFKHLLQVRPPECGLLLSEPLFNLPAIQRATDELVFEDLGFQSLYVASGPALSHLYEASRAPPDSWLARGGCSLVVDCGFSFTHAVPVYQGFVLKHGVKRIQLGGKALTNYLKELVSYRAWNMMDDTYLMEDVKEKLCYCSMDVVRELDVARLWGPENYVRCEYVLPDGIKHKRGFVKDPVAAKRAVLKNSAAMDVDAEEVEDSASAGQKKQQVEDAGADSRSQKSGVPPAQHQDQELSLTNERFLVPEMLFHPADLGMNEAGLAECIVRAVNSCIPAIHPLLYDNVILTGGSCLFHGFKERLEMELRPLVPDEYKLHVRMAENPVLSAWQGGCVLASSPEFPGSSVTKKEYEEHGSLRCRRRFLQ